MPRSPAKSPKNASYASSKTRRSSVSKIFDFQSPPQPKGPMSTSLGTITDPDATAADLLGQGPHVLLKKEQKHLSISLSGPSPSSAAKKVPSQSSNVSTATSQPSATKQLSQAQKHASSDLTSPAAAQVSASHGVSATSGVVSPDSHSTPTSPVSPASPVAEEPLELITVGQGLVSLSARTGALVELTIASIASLLFLAHFLLLELSGCHVATFWLRIIAAFSIFGIVVSVFLVFHSCFEERLTPGRGVLGCLIFFIITSCAIANFVGAIMTTYCICKCSQSAFNSNFQDDLYLFLLELSGSIALVVILFVSSIVHRNKVPEVRRV